MRDKLFKWVDKNKNKDKAYIHFLKGLYLITKDWVDAVIVFVLSIAGGYVIGKENWIVTSIIGVVMLLTRLWYSLVNGYKAYSTNANVNNKEILEEISAITTTLDTYIMDNGIVGVFEYACDLVATALYTRLSKIVDSEIRISIIQQFALDGKKKCTMVSRKSKSRQNCHKSEKLVKFEKKDMCKEYYYVKILVDNKEDMIIFNQEQLEKRFFYKHPERKSELKQYLCIPDKIDTNDIIFLLQLDALVEDAFGKDKDEIQKFYYSYIVPYVSFLRHAYNIENKIR